MKNLKKEEKLIESQKGLMDKFVISNKQNITQNLNENITNEQEITKIIQKKMMFNFATQQILIMNFKIIQKKMKIMMKNII